MIASTDVIMFGNTAPFSPGQIITQNYSPAPYYGAYWVTDRKPMWTLRWVRYMLDDSRIRYAIWLWSSPILSNMKIQIECDDSEAAEFIRETIDRFWSGYAHIPLTQSVSWGYSPSEVIYTMKNGKIHFHSLRAVHPYDARVITRKGKKIAIVVRRVYGVHGRFIDYDSYYRTNRLYLTGPKSFWHVHLQEEHQWYGLSRLKFAYPHWHDKFSDGGAKDSISLWAFKYALGNERIYYPPQTKKKHDGQIFDPEAHASKLAQDSRNGATLLIPNERDSDGNRLWEVEERNTPHSGAELITYHDRLDEWILQAFGIPSELVEAGSSGSGYAGRRVPAQSFYQMLQQYGNHLVDDMKQQIICPLMHVNGWSHVDYDLKVQPLISSEVADETISGAQRRSGGLSTQTLQRKAGSAVMAPRENEDQ